MNNRGFRGRGIGPRGGPGPNNASAASFSGPRFPHPNFRPLRPLLNRPAGPRTWTVRSPRARPYMHWQSNGITHFQNFPRHNVQYRPNAFAMQFRPHNRGRPTNVRPGGHFSLNVTSAIPHEYEADPNLRSNEGNVNKDDVPDSLSLQAPLPGSEEERQQKIAETANRLKEKLSSISKENMISFWEDDFSILKPVTSVEETTSDKTVTDVKYGSPELDLTFNDFRDIGKVRSDSSSKTDTVDGTDCIPVSQNDVEVIKVVVQETLVNVDNDPTSKVSNLGNDLPLESPDVRTSSESDVPSNLKDMQLNSHNVSVAKPLQSQESTETSDGHCTPKDCATEHNNSSHTDIQQLSTVSTKRVGSKIDKTHYQLHNLLEQDQQENSNIENVPESEKLTKEQNFEGIVDSNIALNSGLEGNQKKDINQSIVLQNQSHSTKPGNYGEFTISQQTSNISTTQEHKSISGKKVPNQPKNMKEWSQTTTLPFNFNASVPPPNNNLSQSKDFGKKVVQSAVCSTSKSNMPSNYISGNNGDLLQPSLGFDPRTPPPTFTQNNKAFGKVNTFYPQTQPPSSGDQREYLQPPLIFDPRLSSEERSNLLAHVSNDALRSNCAGSSDSVPGFNASAVTTNFFQMPPVVQPLNFTSDIRMNYLPILPAVPPSPQVPLHKLSTPTIQMSYECKNQVPKPVVLDNLGKKTSEHMNNELEDMQEAMEFAKQVMSMSDKTNDLSDIGVPECPELPSTSSSSSTSNEKVSRDVHSHLDPSINSKTSTRNKEKKVQTDKSKTDTTRHSKSLLKKHEKEEKSKPPSPMKVCNTNNHNSEIKSDVSLKEDQFRSKVTFNLNPKVKKIQSDKWQEKMKDNDKKVKEITKSKKSKDKDLTPQHRTMRDTCKNTKISKEYKSDVSQGNELNDIATGSKESSSSLVAEHTSLASVEVCSKIVNIENIQINTTPIVTQISQIPNKSSKKSSVSVVESSWKNRVINRFLRMSKNDICNMVNNSSLRKFDIAMKHLVKERRSSLSLELRSTEEEKIKSYDREEFMNQLNAMLDPSAVVDISNLPTEFIHHLSEVLQLDPMPFDTEQSLPESQAMSPFSQETNQNVTELNTQYEDRGNSQNQTMFDKICEDSVKDKKKHDETHVPSAVKLDVDPPIEKKKTLSSDKTKTSNATKTSAPMFNMVDLDDIFSEVIAKVHNVSNPVQSNKAKKTCAESERIHSADRKQYASNTQDSSNICDELVSNSRKPIADFDDIFSVNAAETKSHKKDNDNRTQENATVIENKCSSKIKTQEWTRYDQDDSVAFRNLTKEEWEAKYGSLQSAEDESRSSGFYNKVMQDTLNDQQRGNQRSRRVSSTDSSKRRLSISPENLRTSQNFSEHEFFNSDEHTSSYRNYRILRTSDSSSSETSSSGSSNQSSEDMSKMDVVKLLKVIKEKEKIAKTRSLSETLRDEISAEIERSRSEKSKHRERKSRKREKKKKEKKGKRRKQKKKRRKKISDSDSSNSDATNPMTTPRLLTENEIKKEIPVKDENNTEVMKDVDSVSHASEGICSRETLCPASRCDLSSKKNTQMPMTIVPATHLKTKAQLKQMPETSENYIRTDTANSASVPSTSKVNNQPALELKEDKACKTATSNISHEQKMNNRALTAGNISESPFNTVKKHQQESDPSIGKKQDSRKCEVPVVQDDKHKKQQDVDVNVIPEKRKEKENKVCPNTAHAILDAGETSNETVKQNTTTLFEKNSAKEKEVLKNKVGHDILRQDVKCTEEKSTVASEKPLKKLDIETYKKRMQRRKLMEQAGAKRIATKTSTLSENLVALPNKAMETKAPEATLNATDLEDTVAKSATDSKPACLPLHEKDTSSTVPKQNTNTENKAVEVSEQRRVQNKKPNEKTVNTQDTKEQQPCNSEGEFEKIVEERVNSEITETNTDDINPTMEDSVLMQSVKSKRSTSSADLLNAQPSPAEKLLTDTKAHSSKFTKIRSEGDKELKLRKENTTKEEKIDFPVEEHNLQNYDEKNLVEVCTETNEVCHENVNELEKNFTKRTEESDTKVHGKCADIDSCKKNVNLQHATSTLITSDNTIQEDIQMQLTNYQVEGVTTEYFEVVHEVIKNEEVQDAVHDSLDISIDAPNARCPIKNINETVSAVTSENDSKLNVLAEKTNDDKQMAKDSSTLVHPQQISCDVEENDKSAINVSNLVVTSGNNENNTNEGENLSHNLTDSSSNSKVVDTENRSVAGQTLVTHNPKEEKLPHEKPNTLLNSADATNETLDHDIVCSPINTDILSPESSNSPFKGFTEEVSTCICTDQARIIVTSSQTSDTEKNDDLEKKNVLLDSPFNNACCEAPLNNTVDVPRDVLEEDANAQFKQSSHDSDERQNTENITSDKKDGSVLNAVLVTLPTQKEQESVPIKEVKESKKCEDDLITKDSSKEKQVCNVIHTEPVNTDMKNKPPLHKNSSKMITTTDSHPISIPGPPSEDTESILPQTVSYVQTEYQQFETSPKQNENNVSNKPCDAITQLDGAVTNVQGIEEKDRKCTDRESNTQLNAQSKDHTCSKTHRDFESRSTVNCNKRDEQATLMEEGISNNKERLLENRPDKGTRITAATSVHTSKNNDSVHLDYSKRETECTSDNEKQKQKLSDRETMQNSFVSLEKMKLSSHLQTEAKEGTSNGNDSNVNSSSKHFKENGKRKKSSKLHGVKDKQQMKSKPENKYHVSKENIQAAIQSDVVKLASKETIISRMIEIDVEIHKLMMEKMTLYKLLENERLNEGTSPDSSTPSEDKGKEILKVRPDAPTVISQLIKSTDMSSSTNVRPAIKRNPDNTFSKKRKHKNERANVEKSKSDNVRRKRSEAYLNLSSDDEEIMRYVEHAKSLSPDKKKRRKIEEAAGRDSALGMESGNITQTTETDKKQNEPKATSKKNQMTESTQATKQSFRNVKHQKTKGTDTPRSESEALNENIIDSTNQFIGYKSQTYDSDNSKAKPSQSSLSLTASIYSDESTFDSLDQESSSAKSDSKKSTGLALLEESFKREMAASKKLKTVARRKKKKQIKTLLSTVNNLTVEEEELPLNKLYIRKLQQKRDLLVSLDSTIETTNTTKTLPEKSKEDSKQLDKIINDVAENRIEDIPKNPTELQFVDNAMEKVSSTQMEDDECLPTMQTFPDNSLLNETVEANTSYASSETKQSKQGSTPTLLADSHVLKSSENVTDVSVDFHQSITVREGGEPVESTQTDNMNETSSMNPRTMENVPQPCKPAKESEKDAHDGTQAANTHAERDTKIRQEAISRSNEKLDSEQKSSDEIDKCKGTTDDTQLMNPKVEQNTAPPTDVTKSNKHLLEEDQTDTIQPKSAISDLPGADFISNNEQCKTSAPEVAEKLNERDSPIDETICTITDLKDQTNVSKSITVDLKNDKSRAKHEDNDSTGTGSTSSKETTSNLLLEQIVRDTKDTNQKSQEVLKHTTDSSVANTQDKPVFEANKTVKTSSVGSTSGKGVTRRRKKGHKLTRTPKGVGREKKKDSDVNKSLLNVEGSRQTEPSIQEKNTKSNVSSKPLRPAHEPADNVSSNTKRRLTTRRAQNIGNKKRASSDFPVVVATDIGDHQKSHSRAAKRKQHSTWEMMNCKVRLVDSKYTILRPDVNLNMLRQLGISTINPYVRRKSTQEDTTVNFYEGKNSQEARMPTESLMVPQSTKHKDTIESLHNTRQSLQSDDTVRERVVQSSGQGRLTRSEKTQRKSSVDAVDNSDSMSSAKFMETSVAANSHDKLSVDVSTNYEEKPDIEILEEKIHVKEQPKHTEDIPTSCELDIVGEIEQPRTQYTAHKGPILDIKIFNDSFLAASEDGMIYRYNQTSNELLNVYKGHKAAVTCLYIHKMGTVESTRECMYSGALDGTLRCYDIVSGVELKGAIQIGSPIQCMDQAWGIIFIGTKSGHVSRFYVKSNDVRGDTIQFSDKSVLALKATNEGPRKVLIVASRNQPITIRDAQTGLFLRIISGQKSHTVYSLMRDHNLIYCGTSSTSIPVFDFTNGEQMMQYNAGVGIVCMRLYEQLLFAGCYDGNIYVFDTKDRRLVCSIPGPGNMLLSMEIVHYKIIAGSKDKHLQTWLMPRQVRDLLNK